MKTLNIFRNFPVSTIGVKTEWPLNYTECSELPDFLINDLNDIPKIVDNNFEGYISEFASVNLGVNLGNRGFYIIPTTRYDENYSYEIISGGRYYSSSHPRSKLHPLSYRILKNKSKSYNQDLVFEPLYECLVNHVNRVSPIDSITAVPPKPLKFEKNRFDNIVYSICKRNSFEDLTRNLKCIKNYPPLKTLENANQRMIAVNNAFEFEGDISGKHVVLIDDILTTGSTTLETGKVLYKAGAAKVTVIVLGINQFKIPDENFPDMKCPKCNGKLVMRLNPQHQEVFMGCNNYFKTKCDYSMKYNDFIRQYNIYNKIEEKKELPYSF